MNPAAIAKLLEGKTIVNVVLCIDPNYGGYHVEEISFTDGSKLVLSSVDNDILWIDLPDGTQVRPTD